MVEAAPSPQRRLSLPDCSSSADGKCSKNFCWAATGKIRKGLVFTNEFGTHLTKPTVYREYKRIVAAIGCPDARFHDLRHSYAVAAIRAGDDIKTVQGNLGHATAAFTLDVYGHVTDQMKRESADRMERFIRTVSVG